MVKALVAKTVRKHKVRGAVLVTHKVTQVRLRLPIDGDGAILLDFCGEAELAAWRGLVHDDGEFRVEGVDKRRRGRV